MLTAGKAWMTRRWKAVGRPATIRSYWAWPSCPPSCCIATGLSRYRVPCAPVFITYYGMRCNTCVCYVMMTLLMGNTGFLEFSWVSNTFDRVGSFLYTLLYCHADYRRVFRLSADMQCTYTEVGICGTSRFGCIYDFNALAWLVVTEHS